jgi:DNA primase
MSKSSFVSFKAIKAAITMEQVLTHYGLMEKFKRKGDSLNGPCPIHKGTNPTQFRVSVSKNIFNCFSECKHGGNVLDFIAKMEDVSIHAAALKAVEWFDIAPEIAAGNSDEEREQPAAAPKAERTSAPKTVAKDSREPVEATSGPNKALSFVWKSLNAAIRISPTAASPPKLSWTSARVSAPKASWRGGSLFRFTTRMAR